jgi:hypothetical protein
MAFKLKDIVLKGTKEELTEYNYNEMIEITCVEQGLTVEQIRPEIKIYYRSAAKMNADMIIAMRPKVSDK